MWLGLPAGPVVKNSSANAGGHGSFPGPGRFPMLQENQACEQPSQSHAPQSLRSARREATARRGPHIATKESLYAAVKTAQPKSKDFKN